MGMRNGDGGMGMEEWGWGNEDEGIGIGNWGKRDDGMGIGWGFVMGIGTSYRLQMSTHSLINR